MGRFIFVLLMGLSSFAWAEPKPLKSPFPSSVPGISIRNTHILAQREGIVLRGMAPLSERDITDLANFGITEVLIFKKIPAGDKTTAREMVWIAENPAFTQPPHHIEFGWKDITDFSTACRDTLKGLRLIQQTLATKGAGLFFHCTVGEDRTGYLAGMYRVIFEGASPQAAFAEEMCAHGYAEGNPNKAAAVSELVHQNITVLYFKMLRLIATGAISAENLDDQACDEDPISNKSFLKIMQARLPQYRCFPQVIPED